MGWRYEIPWAYQENEYRYTRESSSKHWHWVAWCWRDHKENGKPSKETDSIEPASEVRGKTAVWCCPRNQMKKAFQEELSIALRRKLRISTGYPHQTCTHNKNMCSMNIQSKIS